MLLKPSCQKQKVGDYILKYSEMSSIKYKKRDSLWDYNL